MIKFKYSGVENDNPRTLIDTNIFLLDFRSVAKSDLFYRTLLITNLALEAKRLFSSEVSSAENIKNVENNLNIVIFASFYAKIYTISCLV